MVMRLLSDLADGISQAMVVEPEHRVPLFCPACGRRLRYVMWDKEYDAYTGKLVAITWRASCSFFLAPLVPEQHLMDDQHTWPAEVDPRKVKPEDNDEPDPD